MTPAHPFYMIRHGETDWNRERRFQGRRDIPMNALGRQQATDYAAMLAAERGDWTGWHFVSSPLGRTRETMRIMRATMGLDPDSYRCDDDLVEITFGAWEGQKLDDLRRSEPDLIASREADRWRFRAPGGESYQQACERVGKVLSRLPGPSVIVSHGGVMRGMRHLVEGIDGPDVARQDVPQDNIYHFDGKTGRWMR